MVQISNDQEFITIEDPEVVMARAMHALSGNGGFVSIVGAYVSVFIQRFEAEGLSKDCANDIRAFVEQNRDSPVTSVFLMAFMHDIHCPCGERIWG
jgi:hypothetical protein